MNINVTDSTSSEVSTPFSVVRSRPADSYKELMKRVAQWWKLAKIRYETVTIADWNNKDLVTRAADSVRVFAEIRIQLKKDLSDLSVYQVFDEANKMQGIALVRNTKEYQELECIATNPKNFVLFKGEAGLKGIGQALLTAIINDVYTDTTKSLALQALPSAVSFYKKFDFQVSDTIAAKSIGLTPMTIDRESMKRVMNQKS